MFNQYVQNSANLLHLISLQRLQFAKIGCTVPDKRRTAKLITTNWAVFFPGQFFVLLKFYFEVSFTGQNPAIKNITVTLLHEEN